MFNWIGWPYQIRFEYAPMNYWVYSFLCFAFPVSAIRACSLLNNKILKMSGLLFSGLVAAPAFMIGLVALFSAQDIISRGEDLRLKFLEQAENNKGVYRLYLYNCGATCGPGLILRREIVLPLGVKLVNTEWSQYKADYANLITTETTIKIIYNNRVKAEIR